MQAVRSYQPTRVGLFSNEPIRRTGVHSAFEDHPTIEIVAGEIETLLGDTSLAYLILDVGSDPGWMETQGMVRRIRPDIRQALLGPSGAEEFILRAITAGARAYLDPSCGPQVVRQAMEVVIEGSIWAPRRLISKLLDGFMSQSVPMMEPAAPTFSPRERQVLDLIMNACSNREIADELGIEERTVKAYVASLMRKTGVDNRVSLSVRVTQGSLREQRSLAI